MSHLRLVWNRDTMELPDEEVKAIEWNYTIDVRDKIMARFGDNLPKHFINCMDSSPDNPFETSFINYGEEVLSLKDFMVKYEI